MAGLSDFLENQLLDAVFNAEVTGLPIANVYVKLHIADPTENGTAGAAGNTQRQEMTAGVAASGATSNDNTITWTSVSTTEVYSHISLWDNSTAGNCLWSGALAATKSVNSGDTFTIPIGDLDVTLDGSGAISDFIENQLLDAVFNNETTGLPIANVYVKLHLASPGEDGTGNPAAHTTRILATFPAASGGATSNDNVITWTNVTANETLSHVSLWDASTAGNCLWYGALTASKAVNIGDTFTIAVGDLDVTLD